MIRRWHRLSLLVVVLLMSACALQPTDLGTDERPRSSLQRWVDQDLGPYLATQLSTQPRFRDEPVALVKLSGSEIQPRIDGLTQSMRLQIRDQLLNTPGVTLPWLASHPEAQHHRRLDLVSCRNIRESPYYIGIEISETVDNRFRVSVRALDRRAGEWVSGFGMTWQGNLSASETEALGQNQPDQALRGLRVLPFQRDESDLAADYLAHNLSCLLQQQDEDDLVLYVDHAPADLPLLSATLRLIGNHLSRYREVRITDDAREATFLLQGEAHEIQSGLYQVWIALKPRDSGTHLSGMDTAAYLATGSRSRNKPPDATQRPDTPLLSLLPARGHCARRSAADESCYRLELALRRTERVFLISHSLEQGVVRLLPGACEQRLEPLNFPSGVSGFRLRRLPLFAEATLYTIAVNGAELGERFAQHLSELPDGCRTPSAPTLPGNLLGPWLDRLDHMVEQHADRVAWAANRIP